MKSRVVRSVRWVLLSCVMLGGLGLFNSCGEGGINLSIPGVIGPNIMVMDGGILVTSVLERLNPPAGVRYKIPKFPNSYAEVGPDFESDGTLLGVFLSYDDLLDESGDLKSLPAQELPGGRPLPGVASGKLPAVAFTIEAFHDITLYLGENFFGVFVPVNLELDQLDSNIVSARFYHNSIRAGNLSIVGADENGENSGFLLLLDFSKQTKRIIKKIAKDPAYLKKLKRRINL